MPILLLACQLPLIFEKRSRKLSGQSTPQLIDNSVIVPTKIKFSLLVGGSTQASILGLNQSN